MVRDDAFVAQIVGAADEAATQLVDGRLYSLADAPLGPHREAMRRVKLLVAVHGANSGTHSGSESIAELARHYAQTLHGMQLSSGLFAGGDNVESPPDSGFTLNDVGDTLELLNRLGAERSTALNDVQRILADIAEVATPAMLAGGVHTPNHRWELSSALTRLYRHRPDPRLLARIEQWLAEGIDIDEDGLYSERSANYAVYVTNPSLLAINDILDRPELYAIVERNLEATLDLIGPNRTVETVHSRRQDQNDSHFPLAPYLMHYRRLAIERGRGDFAWAAQEAIADGVVEPQTALTELLLNPICANELPLPTPPAMARRHVWRTARLVVDQTPARRLVVHGGSDYPMLHRIRSGLANNPTFARMLAGTAVESMRLSRDFFGLGPFRADRMEISDDLIVLDETVEGSYYHPLNVEDLRPDGDYELSDEGRFAAAMSFTRRGRDVVPLHTRISIRPTEHGVELGIEQDGPVFGWALELGFRPGGVLFGVDDRGRLDDGYGRYIHGTSAIEFGPGNGDAAPARYLPGEDYQFLRGTDAVHGPTAYITGHAPGVARVCLRTIDLADQSR